MNQSNKKSLLLSLLIFFVMLGSLAILVYQVQKPQEVITRAQTSNCQTLSYPCQEGLISFPNDEGKHTDKQVEWWYINLNSRSPSNGRSLAGAVALVRQKQSDGIDKGYALLELTMWNPGQSFFYKIPTGTITSNTGNQNISFVADWGTDINTIKFYQIDNKPFEYKLEVTGNNINIDLTLKSNKRPLVEGGNGFVPIFPDYPADTNYYSFYYSLTNISFTDGSIAIPGLDPFTASGIAWLDHQWFNSPFPIVNPYSARGNHEWFSIQLNNNVQIVAWNIFKELSPTSFVLKNLDVIDAFGIQSHYEDVTIEVPRSWEYWTAPDGKVLADTWRIFKEGVFDLEVYTSIEDQYVLEAGTYEGASGVKGMYKGNNIEGVGFAEMTLGYPKRPTEPISEVCGDAIDNDLDYRIDEFCTKRVFVTDFVYKGNLGGLTGGDAKCQARANAVGLGGTWKAWLSDSTTNAKDRIANGRYIRLGDNALIANNISDLTDGSIAHPINRNTRGNLVSGGYTWTGTGWNGTVSSSNTCSNWTFGASGVYGKMGNIFYNTTKWTDDGRSYCGYAGYLYCFEQ